MSHVGAGAHVDPTSWPVAVAVLALLVGPYLAAVAALGSRPHRWRRRRTASFVLGALVLAAAVSPVVGAVGGGHARTHMVQHVLLGMAAPLALVLGAPVTLALACLPVRRRRVATAALRSRPVRALAHPATAAALHVGGLYALYLTPLYARSLSDRGVHGLVLLHFVLAGSLFAWSLVGPERAARGPGLAWRVGVLVVASAAHGYLAKLLYARAPALPPGSPHTAPEIQDAARWMYSAGDVVEVALAVALFASWYRRAARGTAPAGCEVRPTSSSPRTAAQPAE